MDDENTFVVAVKHQTFFFITHYLWRRTEIASPESEYIDYYKLSYLQLSFFQKQLNFYIMKFSLFFFLLVFTPLILSAQTATYSFDANPEQPFGLPNPEAPPQILDWAELIGECDCKSIARNPDKSWGDTTDMVWRFKYIMNGFGVQDETLKADGKHSGSIRQFIADSARWYVHYYSSNGPTSVLPAWEGNKNKDGDIILYKTQKAPNGMDGFYKINFTDISSTGFNWLGEWVNTTETFSYPNWKIFCKKRKASTTDDDLEMIKKNTADFSKFYIAGDAKAVANTYTKDGKIFPRNRPIIEGQEGLEGYWGSGGAKVLSHQVTQIEVKIIGDFAYDYGTYSGSVEDKDGQQSDFAGKYVIIWKKVKGDWKIYLDIWN